MKVSAKSQIIGLGSFERKSTFLFSPCSYNFLFLSPDVLLRPRCTCLVTGVCGDKWPNLRHFRWARALNEVSSLFRPLSHFLQRNFNQNKLGYLYPLPHTLIFRKVRPTTSFCRHFGSYFESARPLLCSQFETRSDHNRPLDILFCLVAFFSLWPSNIAMFGFPVQVNSFMYMRSIRANVFIWSLQCNRSSNYTYTLSQTGECKKTRLIQCSLCLPCLHCLPFHACK